MSHTCNGGRGEDGDISVSRIVRVALLSLAVVLSFHEGRAQMSTDAHAWKHFLDEPPATLDLSQLPATARDVVLAKVRIIGSIAWRGGRDQSGRPPPLPKKLFGADVEILDVLRGKAAKGTRYIVSFGVPIPVRKYIYPVTPRMYARDYFIVSYLDGDDEHQLLRFPVSEQEYDEWEREVSEYRRERGRPGARDR
jgi:hypothetical protein